MPITILVVDKDVNILEICRDILEDEGCIVESASAINGLMARLLSEPPEILLLDLEMPGIAGSTFLHEIQQIAPYCCIVGMSVRESSALAEAVVQQKVHDHLVKPFSVEQLRTSVRRCLKLLKLVKREEKLDMRVGKIRGYLYNAANDLGKISEDEER